MKDQRQVLTARAAWFRACSGSMEALIDWFALSLVGAVTGHRFDDGNSSSDRPQKDLQR